MFLKEQKKYLLGTEGKVTITGKQTIILMSDNSVEPQMSEDSVQYMGKEKCCPRNCQHKENSASGTEAREGCFEKSKSSSVHYTRALPK